MTSMKNNMEFLLQSMMVVSQIISHIHMNLATKYTIAYTYFDNNLAYAP